MSKKDKLEKLKKIKKDMDDFVENTWVVYIDDEGKEKKKKIDKYYEMIRDGNN